MYRYRGVRGEVDGTPEEARFEWKIRDFFSLSKDEKSYYLSSPFTFANDSWRLRIFPGGHAEAKDGFVSLYLYKSTKSPCNVSYTFGIKENDGELIGERTDTHEFKKDGRGFGDFFQRSQLLLQRTELLPSDVLTIVCKMKLEAGQTIAFTNRFTRLSGYNLCQDFKKMLLNGQDHDLTLKVGDKKFRAHQNILRSRSDVFDSMLRHDMIEKISGIIDMPDCDPQAFEQFLIYIYSGEVETLDQNNMLELYYIADKYNMTLLKEECSQFIKESVSSTNICDILQLSVNHSDSNLLECATNYLVDNIKDILSTVEWQNFIKKYPTQANELFIKSTNKWYPKV